MEGTGNRDKRLLSILYRTRFKVSRNGQTIVNLSILFSIMAVVLAPWLVVLGLVAALVTGAHFTIDTKGLGFEQNFDDVIRNAAGNVKHAVGTITRDE